jgi:hypothetical protein
VSEPTPEQEFASALADFQADMPDVEKQATGQAGTRATKYADLAHITEQAMPKLAKCGLAYTASPTITDDGRFVLRYALVHKAGHREGGEFPLPTDSNSQQIGSAISYARRYCLLSLTGIAPKSDDDDGHAASAVQTTVTPRDPGRTRGQTKRTKPEGPADDPWTAPPERTTDYEWFFDIQDRLDKCGTAGEVRGLIDEARGKWTEGHLSDGDAQTWKAATEARMTELGAE